MVPCLSDVSLLRSIPLTSLRTILVVLVLAVLTTVVAAVLLPRTVPAATGAFSADRPTRFTRPALRTVLRAVGRYTARIVMVGVPVLLVMALGGLLINRPMHYVHTVGDLAKAAAPRAQVSSRIESPPKSSAFGAAPASAWKASFHDVGDGSQEATWTGPVSGIKLPVRVVLPAGYRPDDGRTYNVLVGLHGWVGDPQSLVTGLASSSDSRRRSTPAVSRRRSWCSPRSTWTAPASPTASTSTAARPWGPGSRRRFPA